VVLNIYNTVHNYNIKKSGTITGKAAILEPQIQTNTQTQPNVISRFEGFAKPKNVFKADKWLIQVHFIKKSRNVLSKHSDRCPKSHIRSAANALKRILYHLYYVYDKKLNVARLKRVPYTPKILYKSHIRSTCCKWLKIPSRIICTTFMTREHKHGHNKNIRRLYVQMEGILARVTSEPLQGCFLYKTLGAYETHFSQRYVIDWPYTWYKWHRRNLKAFATRRFYVVYGEAIICRVP